MKTKFTSFRCRMLALAMLLTMSWCLKPTGASAQINVTFIVDMSNFVQTGGTINAGGLYMAGQFNGWNTGASHMTSVGNNQYSITVAFAPASAGSQTQYKFINGPGGASWESFAGGSCIVSGNRSLTIPNASDTVRACWESCSVCSIPNDTLTLQVDMSTFLSTGGTLSQVHVAGSFQGWNPGDPTYAMTNVSGNLYSVSVIQPQGAYIQYKFTPNANWNVSESPSGACTSSGNRQLTVPAKSRDTIEACYNSCSACVAVVLYSYDTFTVDMTNWLAASNTNTIPVAGIELVGAFPQSNWTPGSSPVLTNIPGTNKYYTVLQLPQNNSYSYKYLIGNSWSDPNESIGGACGDGSGNRSAYIGTSNQNFSYCYNLCTQCAVPTSNITFNIDMGNYVATGGTIAPGALLIAGAFPPSNWNLPTSPALTPIGNNVYTITLPLPQGNTYDYKFVNGGWSTSEQMGNEFCTDGFSTNRQITVGLNDSTISACWQSCSLCPADGIMATNDTICQGSSTLLKISFTGVGPYFYTLSTSTGSVMGPYTTSSNPTTLTVTPTATTNYYINSVANTVNNHVVYGLGYGRDTVHVRSAGGTISPASVITCAGNSQSFSLSNAEGARIIWQYNTTSITAPDPTWIAFDSGSYNSKPLTITTSPTYVRAMLISPRCFNAISTTSTVTLSPSVLNITAGSITSSSATLKWDSIPGATYALTVNGNSYSPTGSSYVLTGLSGCTSYAVSVTANNSNCIGIPTGSTSFKTSPANLSLALTAATGGAIKASWTAGVGPYKLYYGLQTSPQNSTVVNVSSTSYTIPAKSVASGSTYMAYVVDMGTTCTSNQTPYAYYSTSGGSCTNAAPVLGSATSTPVSFTISWAGSASAYQVYYKLPSGSWQSYQTSATSYTATGVAPGTCYSYFVVNRCGTALGLSTPISTVCTNSICGAPLNLAISEVTCRGFMATWNAISGVSSYQVFGSIASGSGAPWIVSYPKPTNSAVFNIFGKNTTVSVYVKSNCTGGGVSSVSNVETVTTLHTGCKEGETTSPNTANVLTNTSVGSMSVYPNPNDGQFIVNAMCANTTDNAKLQVMNLLGQVMTETTVSNNNGLIRATISNADLAAGLYMVRLQVGNETHITRVTVIH